MNEKKEKENCFDSSHSTVYIYALFAWPDSSSRTSLEEIKRIKFALAGARLWNLQSLSSTRRGKLAPELLMLFTRIKREKWSRALCNTICKVIVMKNSYNHLLALQRARALQRNLKFSALFCPPRTTIFHPLLTNAQYTHDSIFTISRIKVFSLSLRITQQRRT